jgi:signal transduction histidine kinase
MLIQLSTLLYIWKVESKVLLEKERENLSYQLDINAKLLLTHMESLQKELEFLATLEVMDDIVVKDIDKRIAVLLEKKSEDLSENIILLAMKDKKLIASSQKEYVSKDFLEFQVPVYASFDTKKKIGSLWLLYPLKNLRELKMDNPHQTLWLEHKGFIPPKLQESIVVSKELSSVLKGWRLSLAYETEYALGSIKEIEKILLFAFMVSLLALLFVVWILSKKQINILHHTQEVLELKRTFLSTISHELRTPLGSILNLTQHLMISSNVKENEVEMLGRIENASEHLLGMINNLLQLSKLESNAMVVQKEKINISKVIEEMIELVEPLIDEKNLMLKTKFELENIEIKTDLNLFKQVVINLLSNAIKFTEKGSITIKLVVLNEKYILSVIDTGIGIEKEKQTELFSEFYQAHMGSTDIKHSTGLGLALSQKVAKLINGKIEIYSQGKDKGVKATFSFSSL